MIKLPFVICAGNGDGDCLIWLLRAFAVDDDNGRSSDEQRYKWKFTLNIEFSSKRTLANVNGFIVISKNVLTIGNGGRPPGTFAGDFWTGTCSFVVDVEPSGFWNVYTVSGGRWWPFSYAVEIVCGRSNDVTGSCECGGQVDTACVWFVAVDACNKYSTINKWL